MPTLASLAGTIGALGAPVARVEFSIDFTPAQMAPVIGAYARHGVRVLALASFYGRIPTAAEAARLAAWARAFGPGGTFWHGRAAGALAMSGIEFGNETNRPISTAAAPSAAPPTRSEPRPTRSR